tara:strand:+ start:598 stop:1296 length:699 start_codon:yes stop_codon:yes gene_type:complete
MRQSISKYKLYFYLILLIFLSSTFNFQLLENFRNKFNLKTINIEGLTFEEKKMLEVELNNFRKVNIFKINKDIILQQLSKFNFIENIYISKIIPSSINIKLSKTSILGKTIRNGNIYYIGKNGQFINPNQLIDTEVSANVFGDFDIQEFLSLHKILNNNKIDVNKIDTYYYFKNKRWDLIFSNELILKLPSNNTEKSIQIYKKLLVNKKLENVKIIDLRLNNQIILTYKKDE